MSMERMKTKVNKRQLLQFGILVTIVTAIDMGLILNGFFFQGYHVLMLALMWLCGWLIWNSFLSSIISMIGASVLQDLLFMLLAKRPLWPLASHEWIMEVFGEWTKFMAWDWWGIPSSYYFALTWIVCLLLINKVVKLRASS